MMLEQPSVHAKSERDRPVSLDGRGCFAIIPGVHVPPFVVGVFVASIWAADFPRKVRAALTNGDASGLGHDALVLFALAFALCAAAFYCTRLSLSCNGLTVRKLVRRKYYAWPEVYDVKPFPIRIGLLRRVLVIGLDEPAWKRSSLDLLVRYPGATFFSRFALLYVPEAQHSTLFDWVRRARGEASVASRT